MTNYQEIVNSLASELTELMGGNEVIGTLQPHNTFSGVFISKGCSIETYDVEHEGESGFAYRVSEDKAWHLVTMALRDADVFDLCKQIVASNVFAGEPLPIGLRHFAFCILYGQYKRPTPAHRKSQIDFTLHITIYQLINTAIIKFGMKLTRNDESAAVSACDAVSDALTKSGINYSFSQIKALCVSPRKQKIRNKVQLFL
ncbi:MAG: hypothetical protein ACSHW1_21235, partial [Yoonia sp.]|uniref:hypothetical protein n=1 Tax=Yoonia sp. TaxID=2212373 RepID=UPI003EF9EE1C